MVTNKDLLPLLNTLGVSVAESGGSTAPVYPVSARKGSDTTRTAVTTPAGDPALTLSGLVANGIYEAAGPLRFTSATTADIRFGWNLPSGAALPWAVIGAAPSVADGVSFVGTNILADIASGIRTIGGAGTTNTQFAFVRGLLIIGTTTGAATLQWAQGTSDAGNTVLKSGAYLVANRLA